jgi:branched-subunit amino acid transport protein
MIDNHYFIWNVIALTVGTIAIRGSFIALSGKMTISPKIRELFTFIPAAIFPALIVPATFFHQGTQAWLGGKERFLILVAASIVSYFVRQTFFVIAFGLTLLYLVTHA